MRFCLIMCMNITERMDLLQCDKNSRNRWGSNPRPFAPEANALSTELHAHAVLFYIIKTKKARWLK